MYQVLYGDTNLQVGHAPGGTKKQKKQKKVTFASIIIDIVDWVCSSLEILTNQNVHHQRSYFTVKQEERYSYCTL